MPKSRHNLQLTTHNLQLIILITSLILNAIFIYQSYERNRITRVVDGDSFDLSDGRRVRLLGLDAPERGECLGKEAHERLRILAQGRRVRLKNIVTDDYGRLLANVILEDLTDTFINKIMVSEGLTRFNSVGSPYKDVLKDAQEKAKAEKLGIWSEFCRNENPPNDCKIKGNIRAGKKTYFLPDCPNYSDVIIDTSYGDRWFCTEEDASSSGFKKASGC